MKYVPIQFVFYSVEMPRSISTINFHLNHQGQLLFTQFRPAGCGVK